MSSDLICRAELTVADSYRSLRLWAAHVDVQDWEAGMTENLHPLFGQKTCPTRERVFETLGKYETKLQQENKTMLYPDV